ncbi:MAG: filamentous hemagglutinin N-terminal domain-containing protein [Xenococcaceae cyanobacterium]
MLTTKIWLFLLIISLGQAGQKATAQVVRDRTLGAESSIINSIDELRSRIEGGATRGENLFHSFEQFSIGEGKQVYFANPEGIANIFSRVTGNNISEILGTLGVDGAANLFFMNPNGIIFGENAFIDVGGSFIATTANSVEFSDGQTFSARNENQKPLLTWNAPIGLGLDGNNGNIMVRGTGHNLLFTFEQLPISDISLNSANTEIFTGDGFALIGNQIIFDKGVLDVSTKKIEIASVERGQIGLSLSPKWEFDYSQVEKLADISLDNFSLVNINGNENVQANFHSKLVKLQNGSLILNSDIASSPQQQITVNIKAKEQLLLRGTTTNTPPSSEGLSRGITSIAAQNINIFTKDLVIESGGQIFSNIVPGSSTGIVNIEAIDSVQIDGFVPSNPLLGLSAIGSAAIGTEKASNVNINTQKLSITNGGVIGSNTNNGQSGDLKIRAGESINIDGFSSSGSILLQSQITNLALGSGASGNININAKDLYILNGGAISTGSFAGDTNGDITINTTNSIVIDGAASKRFSEGLNPFSSITSLVSRINPEQNNVNPRIPISSFTGDAGNISLSTKNLTISNEGRISVQNDSLGDGGIIELNANSLNLNNEGSITAASLSGQGGNITLNTDQLQIRDNSNISTSAQGLGDGGNITIKADSVLAINDSDITATAERGNGGNITIEADGVLGIEERPAEPNNGTSDADASSEFGQDGTVTITNPLTSANDPIIATRDVPVNETTIELIDNFCATGADLIKDLRHADVPANPYNFLDSPEESSPLEDLDEQKEETVPSSLEEIVFALVAQGKNWQPGDPLINANHIVTLDDGRRFLIPKEQWELIQFRCQKN